MTREEARKAAEVMLAYANGEEIELYNEIYSRWEEAEICSFNWFANTYRVKPKEKFDPRVLKPFDKVLARMDGGDVCYWFADFVSTPAIEKYDTLPCIMSNKDAEMIIPYNEDTKHLVGTNEEAPEYYRYW